MQLSDDALTGARLACDTILPIDGMILNRRTALRLPLIGSLSYALSAHSAATATNMSIAGTPPASPAIEASLSTFQASLSECRRLIRSAPYYNRSSQTRAQAEYFLQQISAAAYTMAIMPRQNLPFFLTDTYLAPGTFTHSGPNPDARYRVAYLDGSKSFRIWGKRNTSPFCYMTVNSEHSLPESKLIGFYRIDDFHITPDGRFDIRVSAQRDGATNWIKLDPNSDDHELCVRVGALNPLDEIPVELHIEPIDIDLELAPPLEINEADLSKRISKAARMIHHITSAFVLGIPKKYLELAGGQKNVFGVFSGETQSSGGAAPGAIHGGAMFEFNPGEALIVESDIPDAVDWSFQTRDIWLQQPDYIYHQSVLNKYSAVLDRDNKFRAVVSLVDPGVPNWLDSMGMIFGQIQFRLFDYGKIPSPIIRRVKLSQVRDYLPSETPKISKSERLDALRKRRLGLQALFGR
jgi:hypothetical protein